MVGGGKVGGPTSTVPTVPTSTPNDAAPAAPARTQAPTAQAGDKFEMTRQQAAQKNAAPGLAREGSGPSDILKLARSNPEGARHLLATMLNQTSQNFTKVQQELAGARAMLEQLAREGYSKKALLDKGRELRKARDRLAALKTRLGVGRRKMALLEQLAGRLGDPRLNQALDRLLSHHRKLRTAWGKRHHLLAEGGLFYGDEADTPEHLREVVRADVRAGAETQRVAEIMQEISPRRVISEMIARTLDGSVVEEAPRSIGMRGEHGRTLQSWGTLSGIMSESLATDPFGEDEG